MPGEYCPNMRSTFLYFAYGSNLLTKRIHLQNPSAIRKGIAELKGYRLGFYVPTGEPNGTEPRYGSIWSGASATVIEDEKHSVWGALYEIDLMHMASLDIQEGVHLKKYIPLIKNVVKPNGEEIECRLYQMLDVPSKPIDYSDPTIPDEHKPSKTYKEVFVKGGEESQLPEKYMRFLKSIVHNGRDAHPDLLAKLYGEKQ